ACRTGGDTNVTIAMAQHCFADPSPWVVASAMNGLGPSPRPRQTAFNADIAVPILIDLTRHSNATVRCSAIKRLGGYNTEAEAAAKALVERLTDPDWGVRGAATNAIELVAPGTLVSMELLADPHPQVRGAATNVLRKYNLLER